MTMFENHLEYLRPIWNGGIITDESIMPLYKKGESGELTITLANEIKRVIYVKSATLETEFEQGKDYFVRDKKLVIPADSKIRILPWEEYNTAEGNFVCTLGGYLTFGEGNRFHSMQYAVTYEAEGNLFDGKYIPTKSAALANSQKVLADKERPLKLAFYGDSITYGCNASGLGAGLEPFMPVYPLLAAEGMRKMGCSVDYYNPSIGGKNSDWGDAWANFYFDDANADVTVIAFGMNDGTGRMPVETYIAHTKSIIDKLRAVKPDSEFILVSTTLPNPISTFVGLQEDYELPLAELAEREGCAYLNMTELHRTLLTRKEYHHMTGNNINHPTDFLARVYAMGVLALLGL